MEFERRKRALISIAVSDPDFLEFFMQLPQGIRESDFPNPETMAVMFDILNTDENMAELIQAHSEVKNELKSYAMPGLGEVGVLAAALFLLQMHIKIERNENGKWVFVLEHKVGDSSLMKKVVDALRHLLESDNSI